MEQTNTKRYDFSFRGKGGDFFGVVIINWLLTIITLGIYYPWAKEKTLKYLYSNSYLEKDNFQFTGTGKEMFVGFIKVYVLFVGLYLGVIIASATESPFLLFFLVFIFYAAILFIVPFAIHGFYRYRMSRTNWRGVRFGYRGDRSTFIKLYFKNLFLTIITFGIYGFWMTTNIRNYTLSNIRFGNASFKYNAKGDDYFMLNLKGIFLTYVTLGIYSFWFQRDLLRFYFDHLSLHHDDKKIKFQSKLTTGEIFELLVINMLILIFTLGLGYAFVEVRTLTKLFSKIEIEGNINLDELKQTEAEYKNAFGDETLDFLDISGFF